MSLPLTDDKHQQSAEMIARKYLSLFHGISNAIFVHPFSEEGFKPYIEVNEAACQLLGYTKEELLQLSAHDITSKEDVEKLCTPEQKKQLLVTGQMIIEATFITKNKTLIPVEINSQFFDHLDQKVVLSIVRDISERLKATRKLKENEELLELIYNSVSEGFFFTDLDGNIQKVNQGAINIHGFSDRDELIGKSFYELIIPQDRKRAQTKFQLIKTESSSYDSHYNFFKKHGLTFTGALSVSLLNNSHGSAIGYTALIKDMTEIIRTEQALRDSETRYKLLSEATFEAIFIFHHERCTSFNHAAKDLFGFHESDVLGEPFIKWIHPDFRQYVQAQIYSGYTKPFEAVGVRTDLTTFFCEIQLKTKKEKNKSFLVIALRDISVRKKAEETKLELEEQLRQALKMEAIGRLTGGVAHDFNNILTVIISQSELLLKRQLSPKILSDIKRIHKSGKRASRLTNQLLAFSRKQMAHPKVINFNAIIQDQIKMLQRLLGENIEIQQSLADEEIFVTIDISQLEQIIMNLCVNARDAMIIGGVLTLKTSIEGVESIPMAEGYEAMTGKFACLEVTDNGCGMDSKTLSHIFEPFFTTKNRGEGTGLGLSTVYGIIKQNHGSINVQSVIDKGTTFKVYLPLTQEVEPSKTVNDSSLNIHTNQATILLVEDDENVRQVAMETLIHLGYQVISAENGKIGYNLYNMNSQTIDLLITDVVMPIMGGKELAERVSKHNPKLPIIFISGYTDDIISNQGIVASEIHLIQKPFDLEELSEMIAKILNL